MSDDSFVNSATLMGTVVRIEVVGPTTTKRSETTDSAESTPRSTGFARSRRAVLGSIRESALRQLTANAGTAVAAPQMLFELVRFALALARGNQRRVRSDGRRSHGSSAGSIASIPRAASSEQGSTRRDAVQLSRRRPRRA